MVQLGEPGGETNAGRVAPSTVCLWCFSTTINHQVAFGGAYLTSELSLCALPRHYPLGYLFGPLL